MLKKRFTIPLFHPYVTPQMQQAAYDALGEKIIAQGKTVEMFEKEFEKTLGIKNPVAVNSCTSALELAYHLLDLQPGDEVITPVFTFAATNIPLLRRGVNIVFADIKENLLMDWDDALKKITPKTKAIINVHLFDQLSEVKQVPVPVIGDAAEYLGKTSGETFTCYSFQATKIMTTVDGGMLACSSNKDYKRAKLLRWYGIDRDTDKDTVDVDISEAGFKYTMNNVTAAIGLAAFPHLPKWQATIRNLQNRYRQLLGGVGGSPYLIHTPNRKKLRTALASLGIETGLVLRRNDRYSIFGGKRQHLPNMDRLENTYLLLPCHTHMSTQDVEHIASVAKKYL